MIQSLIHTTRLTLLRLTDTTPGHPHVQYFHEDWSDLDTTSWSLHGPCHSYQESREWMVDAITKRDNLYYAVFAKVDGVESTEENPGVHIGSIGLRRQDGPTLPPPKIDGNEGKEVDLRVIGYAIYKRAWGKGYASEAAKAVLSAYAQSVANEKAKGEKVFYVEAGVDEGNPASLAVLKKAGFKEVGWKTETEAVFLGGAWRHGGYWIYGQYV
ncbi:acyl-CoA N-acyltransferase [Setomelanomma holmii]|uniref:Acyl-CoA N-acyltransferase n=1 Tax=Setomelanomma holmii TaxID=210430 RepID=A0A9P4HHB6_9PLEO|nr:acyl-CoA N-acyltransferase [Setomelanomma holmii]